MGAKLFSASISILCLYFLHCPQAKAAGAPSQRFYKAQKATGCELAALRFSVEECASAPHAAPAFLPEKHFVNEPARIGAIGFAPELPSFGARSFLFRSGLSPPSSLA